MTVLEIARFSLPTDESIDHPTIRRLLQEGKKAMEDYKRAHSTPEDTFILRGDDFHAFILGTWSSLQQHLEGFVPTDENQRIMGELTETGVKLDYFGHFDCGDVSLAETFSQLERCKIWTLTVPRRLVGGFDARRPELLRGDSDAAQLQRVGHNGGQVLSGWRVDMPEDSKETHFVVVSVAYGSSSDEDARTSMLKCVDDDVDKAISACVTEYQIWKVWPLRDRLSTVTKEVGRIQI